MFLIFFLKLFWKGLFLKKLFTEDDISTHGDVCVETTRTIQMLFILTVTI